MNRLDYPLSFYFSRPAIVRLDLTNRCNIDCRYCYNKANAFLERKEMSDAEFEAVVRKIIQELDPCGVSFTGGEPLLRKNLLIKCTSLLKENNIDVGMNTNGLLLDDQTIVDLKNAGMDAIAVNIESLSDNKHDFLRGEEGALEKTLYNLSEVKKLWDPQKVTISVVVNKKNVEDLVELAVFVKKNGFGSLRLIDMVPTSNNDKKLLLTRDDWLRFYSTYRELENMQLKIVPNHALLFLSDFIERNRADTKLPFCVAGRLLMSICADGTIVPCDFFKDADYICGNALKDNLLSVWQNSVILKKFRESVEGNERYVDCVSCKNLESCNGGCKAFANSISSNPFSPDPYCKIYELNKEK
jgi:radical SAM protein with 4Fe4S-binding SPASM domain